MIKKKNTDKADLLELIELENGDVVLRRAESDEKPIVSISFSSESNDNMQDLKMHVARSMVDAAISTYQSAMQIQLDESSPVLH